MILIEHVETEGWKTAVRGMRNPLNSWGQSDSTFTPVNIGYNDFRLMKKLVTAGPDHAKFLRQIGISMDIVAPLYWWKEYDTYKVGTTANSCSTMHTIAAKAFTADDFSHEHLDPGSINVLETVVKSLNYWRRKYLQSKDKEDWWQMIQLLPSSYNQKRTVTLNYEVARRQYKARKAHKLDEWVRYCKTLESMPYSELITLEGER